MRISSFRTFVVLLLLSSALPVSSARATQAPVAIKQSVRVIAISDHCIDEFDEEDTVYINEGDATCKMTVQVRGRGKTKSKVALEYYDEDEGWIRTDYKVQTTSAAGKVTFYLEASFPTEVGDDCYESDSWTHRFAISRSGRFKAFKSATFEVTYTSSDTNPACSYEE